MINKIIEKLVEKMIEKIMEKMVENMIIFDLYDYHHFQQKMKT